MKKIAFIIVLFFVSLFTGTAQEKDCKVCTEKECKACDNKTEVKCDIIIDLNNTENIVLPKEMKPGEYYRVVVKHVNLNNYFVLINNEDSTVSTALELPVPGSLSIDNLSKLTSSFNQNVTTTQEKQSSDSKLLTFQEAFTLNPKNGKKEEEIKEALNDFNKKINKEIDNLKAQNDLLDKEKMKLYEYRLLSYSETETAGDYNFKTALDNFNNMRGKADAIKASIKDLNTEFESYLKKNEALITNEELKKNVGTLKKIFEESNKVVADFKELISADNVEKLLTTILNLTKDKCFVSAPIQFTKEQAKLKVELTPKAEKSPLPKYNFGPYLFPVDYDTYWSVGTSIYYAFNLDNERYSVVGTTASGTTTYRIVEEDKTKGELGIAALLRYGSKDKGTNFGQHISLGTGVSIEKSPRPRLLLGGGISLGKKHNFTFDAGLIAGYVDTGSNTVDLNTTYSVAPTTVTVTKLKLGGFVSIGYMFKIN